MDQLTLQTGASKAFSNVDVQALSRLACFQINTHLSSEQLATMLDAVAMLGAQATSRTQSKEVDVYYKFRKIESKLGSDYIEPV
jgi:hypothetical protein